MGPSVGVCLTAKLPWLIGCRSLLVLDLKLKLPAPIDDCAFADFQILGDASEAPGLRTEEDEASLDFDMTGVRTDSHPTS